MTARPMVTAAEMRQENQKKGLRPGLEALQSDFDINLTKAVRNLFAQEDGLADLKQKTHQERKALTAQKAAVQRTRANADTEQVIKAVRKGEAPDLGADPITAIDAALDTSARTLKAIDLATTTTAMQITLEIRKGDYLEKLHKTWAEEWGWRPEDDTTYAEVRHHEGRLELFVMHAMPLVVGLEHAKSGEVTSKEIQTLRKLMQTHPEVLPTISSIREKTRSQHEKQSIPMAAEERKAAKVAQTKVDITDAAEAARYRASGRKNQQADNSEVVEKMAAHAAKLKENATATK